MSAKPIEQEREPKTWAIIGVFFAYFTVAKDVPGILRDLFGPGVLGIFLWLINLPLRLVHFQITEITNPWLLRIFTVAVVVFFAWLHRSSVVPRQSENAMTLQPGREKRGGSDEPTDEEIWRRVKLMRAIRSLGLIPFREWRLERRKVIWYGTFKRPKEWKDGAGRTPYVDRLMFEDTSGVEYQYAADHSQIFVRRSPVKKNRDDLNEITSYGPEEARKPTWDDIKLLLIASNHFPWWWVRSGFKHQK